MRADVGIIGGGPAGLSALLWCNSLGMDAILFEGSSELGGQMPRMYHPIIDYPGLLPRDGRELRDRFVEHIDRLNLLQRCLFREQAVEVRRSGTIIDIRSTTQTHTLQAVVLSMGVRVRRLEIPGEREFERKGVSFSATRDHPLVAGKTAVVVGGGDSAVENSLILARVCKHVYLVHRSDSFRARAEWLSEARNNPVITVIPNAKLTSIHGDSSITHVEIEDQATQRARTLNAEAVFVRIGMAPNSEVVSGHLRLNSEGFVEVNANQQSSVDMIYAAGDICGPVSRSVATAVGHGATAAKHIARKLNQNATTQ